MAALATHFLFRHANLPITSSHLEAVARRGSRLLSRPPNGLNTSGVEPDIEEDYRDRWATAGEGEEDLFPWGIADGAHSWHKNDEGTFWEHLKEDITVGGGPTGFQAVISWLFLPGLFTGLAFQIQAEYLYLYTILFMVTFITIELGKPDKESNYEPEMYQKNRNRKTGLRE